MLVNFANKSLTGFFLLNIFTHISEGAVLLQFSVMCCRFPLFSETCKHGPACGLKNKTNMQTHTGSHTNTIRGYQRGLMCLAQLYHLLLSEAFCDEGIFQVANHYFLQAPGFSKDCYQVCACVLMWDPCSFMVTVLPYSQTPPPHPILFFRGFMLPFQTILKAPFPFVNTCLSCSKPVCFAVKGFFFCTSIIPWDIAECAASINI